MYIYLLLTLFVILQAGGSILLKYNGSRTANLVDVTLFERFINPLVISGLLSYGFSFILFVYILSVAKLSLAASFAVVMNYTILIIFSHFFFNEKITSLTGFGLILIISGLFFIIYGQ